MAPVRSLRAPCRARAYPVPQTSGYSEDTMGEVVTRKIETDFIANPCAKAVLATQGAAKLGVLVDAEANTIEYRR